MVMEDASSSSSSSPPSCRLGSYALGLVFIFLVSCSWAGASVLIQYIYQDLAFDSPFIITYVCTSLFAVYLPWVYACGRLGVGHNPPLSDDDPDSLPTSRGHATSSSSLTGSTRGESVRGASLPTDHQPLKGPTSDEADYERRPSQRWSHERTMRVARVICPLWFVANFTYNLSLAMTSVTSNTIISTTSSLWTFIFSTFFGLEGFSWAKLVGLTLSFAGTVMVGCADTSSGGGTDTVLGDALCLFSAIMYGVYTTALRVLVPDDRHMSFQLLFGYIGLFNAAALLPVVLILALAAPQVFAGFSASVLGFIVVNGLCDNVLSDYLWARAIVLTSPTVATVGLSLTIPLAFISDTLLGKGRNSSLEVLGAMGVVAGFLLVSYKGHEEDEQHRQRQGSSMSEHRPLPMDPSANGFEEDDDGIETNGSRGVAAAGGGGGGRLLSTEL